MKYRINIKFIFKPLNILPFLQCMVMCRLTLTDFITDTISPDNCTLTLTGHCKNDNNSKHTIVN